MQTGYRDLQRDLLETARDWPRAFDIRERLLRALLSPFLRFAAIIVDREQYRVSDGNIRPAITWERGRRVRSRGRRTNERSLEETFVKADETDSTMASRCRCVAMQIKS